MASLVAAREPVDVSGEGCEVVIFEDNLRGACDTIDSGQLLFLRRQTGPLPPSSTLSPLRASGLTTIAAALSRCRAFAPFGAAGRGS